MNNQESNELKINIEDLLCDNSVTTETKFYFNHPEHKFKVSIIGQNKDKYRAAVRWDFGDGTIIEAPEATHYYKNAGTYTISVTLYGTDGSIHNNDVVSSEIIKVKELVPTELSFIQNDSAWDRRDYYISKNNNLGKLQITLGPNIISSPSISVFRCNKNDEKSYNDIKNKIYYHLYPYYTFLEKIESFNIDQAPKFDILLKPTTIYIPSYIRLFAKLEKDSVSPKLPKITFYYLSEREIEEKDLNLYFYTDLEGNTENAQKIHCYNIKDIPDGAFECGKVGFVDIWYKNDNAADNELIFEIKKDTLKLKNESSLNETYLNIPPLGFTFKTKELEISDNRIIKALSGNGLYKNIKQENNELIDNYLKHNFYKGYTVDAYYSYFIENDELDNKITYNLYKSKNLNADGLSLSDNNDGIDCKIECEDEENDEKNKLTYLKIYKLTPQKDFSLYNNEKQIYKHNNLITLDELIIPSEKTSIDTLENVLGTYMQHQMFDETPKLKTFLKDSINKDTFNYIVTKGNNFFDDYANIKTCYVDVFLSMMQMLNEPIKKYKIDSFNKIKDLKEFIRILSMNYSTLFGNIITTDYDIKITNAYKGKNVGTKLEYNDVIFCDKNYDIVGFRHGNYIHRLSEPTPYVIIYDNSTLKIRLASFYKIPSALYENFNEQTEEWRLLNDDFIDNVEYIYDLNDYEDLWGWDLLLPDEINNINNKGNLINNYYSFYLFNPVVKEVRKNNFIEESTIPYKDGKQISVDEWNDTFGFTYNCLMKILLGYYN